MYKKKGEPQGKKVSDTIASPMGGIEKWKMGKWVNDPMFYGTQRYQASKDPRNVFSENMVPDERVAELTKSTPIPFDSYQIMTDHQGQEMIFPNYDPEAFDAYYTKRGRTPRTIKTTPIKNNN